MAASEVKLSLGRLVRCTSGSDGPGRWGHPACLEVHGDGRQWNRWLWLGTIDPWGKDKGRGWLMSRRRLSVITRGLPWQPSARPRAATGPVLSPVTQSSREGCILSQPWQACFLEVRASVRKRAQPLRCGVGTSELHSDLESQIPLRAAEVGPPC